MPALWKSHPELVARATRCQNHERNDCVDVLTIIGFMTTEAELVRHVEFLEANCAWFDAKPRRRKVAA